jgi:putative MFS transporter
LSALGFKGSLSILLSASLYVPGFLGAMGAAYLNDTTGRRTLQIVGFGGMTLGMILIAAASAYAGALVLGLGIIGLILWYGIGNLGPGNTMGLYAIELLPTKLRSSSMGSATAITRFVSFLSAFEFPFIALSLGKLTFFEVLVVVMAFAFVFTILFTPETKGLTLEQIAKSKYRPHRLEFHYDKTGEVTEEAKAQSD